MALCALSAIAVDCTAQSIEAQPYFQNAAGSCDAALPQYDDSLRKRPTGFRNQSAEPAFVSCSAPSDFIHYFPLAVVYYRGANVDAVQCVLVNGTAISSNVRYYAKSGEHIRDDRYLVVWDAENDFTLPTGFGLSINFSCVLAPGAEISFIGQLDGQ